MSSYDFTHWGGLSRLSNIEQDVDAIKKSGVGTTSTLSQVLTNGNDAGGHDITGVGDITLSGLTGATAAARFVGGTGAGKPITGTFAVGDFVVDQTGSIWVCTAAGSPGTWVQLGGSPASEIGYDQITTSASITTTTEPGDTVITGSSYTFDGSPVMMEFFCSYAQTPSGQSLYIDLVEGTTQIGRIGRLTPGSGQVNAPLCLRYRFTPSVGSHTYTVKAWVPGGGTGTINAGAAGTAAHVPAFLRFTKV